jgi:hypothetical protein
MADLAFGVAAYAACDPQRDCKPAVYRLAHGGFCDDTAERAAVPTLLRRRVGPIGQMVLRAAWSLREIDCARFIFASRHGEFDRTLKMLNEVADDDGPTPADFSLSVHNALAGLLSVCTGNRRGHIALAAGVDSFGFGLMEAAVCLFERPEEPVMLAYYDAGLPHGYPDTVPACAEATQALALILMPPQQAALRSIVMTATPAATAEPGEAAAAVFLRFLQTTAPEASAAGERMNWTWRHG